MSYTVKDKIQGKAVRITYDAVQRPLPAGTGRMEKSSLVRQHLSDNKSACALVVRNAEFETWWAAEEPGVSFAAAIDVWHETRLSDPDDSPPEDFVVVIPTDRRIYLAEIQRGLVSSELLVLPEVAEQHLQTFSEQSTIIYGFSGGACTDLVAQYVQLDPPPFALQGYVFKRAYQVLPPAGLYHPVYVLFLAMLIGIIAVIPLLINQVNLWNWFDTQRPNQAKKIPQIITPKVSWTAGESLRILAGHLAQAPALYVDGLTKLDYSSGGIIYTGRFPVHWPAAARRVADHHAGVWQYNGNDWSAKIKHPNTAIPRSQPLETEVVTRTLLIHPLRFKLTAGPTRQQIDRSNPNIQTRPVTSMTWIARAGNVTLYDLIEGARLLDRLPAEITAAQCQFSDYRLETCELTLETTTL